MEIECVVLVAMTDFSMFPLKVCRKRSRRLSKNQHEPFQYPITHNGYNHIRIIRSMFGQALSSCSSSLFQILSGMSFRFTRPKPQVQGIPQRARGVDNNGAYWQLISFLSSREWSCFQCKDGRKLLPLFEQTEWGTSRFYYENVTFRR